MYAYSTLACLISWGAMLALVGFAGFPLAPDRAAAVGSVALLGPSVAGLGMILARERGPGLRTLCTRLLRFRVPARWYAVALLLAPCVDVLSVSILSLHTPELRFPLTTTDGIGALFSRGLIAGLVVGLFEELGWTGFAVPALRREAGIVFTGLVVGLVWGLWHFPMFWQPDSFAAPLPFLLLMAKLFAWLPPYRILMVWLHEGTQSLLMCVLMHACLVLSLTCVEPPMTGGTLLGFIAVRATLLWLVVVAVALRVRKSAE